MTLTPYTPIHKIIDSTAKNTHGLFFFISTSIKCANKFCVLYTHYPIGYHQTSLLMSERSLFPLTHIRLRN
jgi:hypothetical protein